MWKVNPKNKFPKKCFFSLPNCVLWQKKSLFANVNHFYLYQCKGGQVKLTLLVGGRFLGNWSESGIPRCIPGGYWSPLMASIPFVTRIFSLSPSSIAIFCLVWTPRLKWSPQASFSITFQVCIQIACFLLVQFCWTFRGTISWRSSHQAIIFKSSTKATQIDNLIKVIQNYS